MMALDTLGTDEPYALYMVGDTMSPRYEHGWLLHIDPAKPATRGRTVVVHKTDGVVLIKQFVERTNKELVLRQLNPDKTLSIPAAEVAQVHLIVGSDQE